MSFGLFLLERESLLIGGENYFKTILFKNFIKVKTRFWGLRYYDINIRSRIGMKRVCETTIL